MMSDTEGTDSADVTSQVRAIEIEGAQSVDSVQERDRRVVDGLVQQFNTISSGFRDMRRRILAARANQYHARVLVLDDDPDVCRMIRRTLIVPGKVDTVLTVGAALDHISLRWYDMAFVDVVLDPSSISGIEAVPLLRAKSVNRQLPIVLISAYGTHEELMDKARSCGANRALTKPFEPWVIRQLVDEFTAPSMRHARPSI